MFTLLLGLSLFIGLHSLRELGLRQRLLLRLSVAKYKALVAIGVLMSVALIVAGKAQADFIQVWVPAFNLRPNTHLLMISACILFVAGILPPSYTRRLVLHPMLLSVIVWGAAHLLSNGDLASAFLFGSLGAWALFKMLSLRLAKQRPLASRQASLVWDAAAIFLGMIAYSALLLFHGPLFGFALGPLV